MQMRLPAEQSEALRAEQREGNDWVCTARGAKRHWRRAEGVDATRQRAALCPRVVRQWHL